MRQRINRRRGYRPPAEDKRELDYDAIARMDAIDNLARPWRDLINEHGFVPVVQCLQETRSLKVAAKILEQRWQNRQRQLANGTF